LDDWGNNITDIEVGHSIAKYLTKLETLCARIFATTNADYANIIEEMTIMIAKRLPRLTTYYGCKWV
jgi:hypothetical protein